MASCQRSSAVARYVITLRRLGAVLISGMDQKLRELRHQLEDARADLRAIESHLAKGENNAARQRAQEAIVRLARLIEIEKLPPRT